MRQEPGDNYFQSDDMPDALPCRVESDCSRGTVTLTLYDGGMCLMTEREAWALSLRLRAKCLSIQHTMRSTGR